MRNRTSINMGNLLLSLSNAVDLANPAIAQHQQRTAYIALEICRTAGYSIEQITDIFTAALLHDVGAISIEEKILLHRFETENVAQHCLRGELLLKRVPEFAKTALIVKYHHTPWTQIREMPQTEITAAAQVIQLADYIERLIDRDSYILNQTDDIMQQVKAISGSMIDPGVVAFFNDFYEREEFWLDLISPRLYWHLFHSGPFENVNVDYNIIEHISKLFRDIIDFKSPFTATHTSGVSACAEILSRMFGLTETGLQEMKIAGNFHDLGKLIIPNSILEKPGKLTKEEYNFIKCHSYYSYHTINSIKGLEHLAEWAGFHHERLDGSGYPFHCKSGSITIFSRIMTVADIFTAIAEDRPYRKKITKNGVNAIMGTMADNGLIEKKVVELLLDNFEEVNEYVKIVQEAAEEFYTTRLTGI